MYEELIRQLRILSGTDNISTFDEAADAIEDLEFACNRYERDYKALCDYLPKWIPVTERLPEKYHQVLVYGLNGMQIDYYAGEKSIGGRPLFMISEAKVTHWTPLPEPPKEDNP